MGDCKTVKLVDPPIIPTEPNRHPRYWLWFYCLIVLVGVVLVRSGISFGPPCIFRSVTGWPCCFCGGTRALRALAVFDLGTALSFNPLTTCLALGTGVILLSELCRWFGWRQAWLRLPMRLKFFLPWVVFFANWFYVIQHGV